MGTLGVDELIFEKGFHCLFLIKVTMVNQNNFSIQLCLRLAMFLISMNSYSPRQVVDRNYNINKIAGKKFKIDFIHLYATYKICEISL